jgi:hypothetical protein
MSTTHSLSDPPSTKLSSNSKTVKDGDNLQLTCEASGGNPTSYTYLWYYNNGDISNETTRGLYIKAVKFTQSGTYRCRASNSAGYADAEIGIDILCKYRIFYRVHIKNVPASLLGTRFEARYCISVPCPQEPYMDIYVRSTLYKLMVCKNFYYWVVHMINVFFS